MTEKTREHGLEQLLELYSRDPFVFRPSELYVIDEYPSLREELRGYNIYLVATRPRISIIPTSRSFVPDEQIIQGCFSVNLGLESKQIPFSYTNPFLPARIIEVHDLEYPYDHLRFMLAGGTAMQIRLLETIRYSKTALAPYSDLLVEYVGQSYGDNGDSDAVNRLIGRTGKQGHGSLQKVFADLNASRPENEVYLLLYSYEFYKKAIVAGGWFGPAVSDSDASGRVDGFMKDGVTREDRLNLVEAALIRYFQPTYNDIYKKSFPQPTHEILNVLFDLDITGLSVSLSTQEHNFRIYSKVVAPSDRHWEKFPIVRDEQRASFLDIAFP